MRDYWDDAVTSVWVRAPHDTRPDYPLVPVAAIEPAILARPPQRFGIVVAAVAAATLLGSAMALGAHYYLESRASLVAMSFEAEESDDEIVVDDRITTVAMTPDEDSRVLHWKSAAYRDLWRDVTWYHPLADAYLPGHSTRKFGAKRPGHRPLECGRGHCGVDLGHFGLIVRAANDGVVDRVQRHPTKREGRYVRVLHDDGYVSYYMHLHRIRDDLENGMRVKGGEPIGMVGRSGIKRSAPHLHFALAYLVGNQRIFVDPEPLLRRAVLPEDLEPIF